MLFRLLLLPLLITMARADDLGVLLDRLATVESRVEEISKTIDAGDLPAQPAENQPKTSVDLSNIIEKLHEIQSRLTALEQKSGGEMVNAGQKDFPRKKEGLDLGTSSESDDDVEAILRSLDGSAAVDAKTPAEARAILKAEQTAPTLPSNNFEAQYNEALGLLERENFVNAASAFQYCLKNNTDPKNEPRVLYQLGRSYYGCKEFAKAKKTFAEVYRKEPKGQHAADSLFYLAKVFIQESDNKKACTTLREIKRRFSPMEKGLETKLKAAMADAKCEAGARIQESGARS